MSKATVSTAHQLYSTSPTALPPRFNAKMTSPAIAEFRILHLRPATTVEEDGTAVHKMWEEAITDLKKADGCKRVFFGRKVEDPSAGVLCVGEFPLLPRRSGEQ